MQNIRFTRSTVACLFLSFASSPTLGAEMEYALQVDALAPIASYWRSFIVEARVERDGWSAFVAPELIARDYEITELTFGGPIRQVTAKGFGIWTGFGVRPWREDFLRSLRIGLGLRARRYDSDIASFKTVSVYIGGVDSFMTIVSKRREVTNSLGISSEVAWTSFPFGGSDFLRKVLLEPYARVGLRSDRLTTTAYEGGDREPGTTSSHKWTRDIRLGMCVGRVF